MQRRSRTLPIAFIAVVAIAAIISAIVWTRPHESLSKSEVAASNATISAAYMQVTAANKAVAVAAASGDQVALAQSLQALETNLTTLGGVLQTRLDAEKHLGSKVTKLKLQLTDMNGKVDAAQVGGTSPDALTSAQADLQSATSDATALVNSVTKL